jgi:hypothetical protein
VAKDMFKIHYLSYFHLNQDEAIQQKSVEMVLKNENKTIKKVF